MTWLRRAALQGHMLAANDLALLYLQEGASKRALALRYVCVGVCVRAREYIDVHTHIHTCTHIYTGGCRQQRREGLGSQC